MTLWSDGGTGRCVSVDKSHRMLCGENEVGIDESFKDVEELGSFSSFGFTSCTDASCSTV